MPGYSLKPGGLFAETLPSRSFEGTKSPDWCTHLRDPTVHSMRLLWMPRFIRHLQEDGETILKSPSFTFKESWLKGNLVTPSEPENPNEVYLQMAPGLEKRVQGKVMTASSRTIYEDQTELSVPKEGREVLFSPATYRGWWNLGRYTDYYNDRSRTIIHLLIDFVILEDAPSDFACCHTKLCIDFALLLADKEAADTIIKVGTTELGAHRVVLGARSPVLKAMLSADMVEGRTGVIELKEMSAVATETFVNFIYTAQVDKEKLTETAEELLGAASMYDMPDLKVVCETALRQMITVDNTARFLLLASLHEAALLKSATLDFFVNNKEAVIKTEEWKVLVTENCKLFLDEIITVI